MKKSTDKQKQDAINRYANDEAVSNIGADVQILRSTIYSCIKDNQESQSNKSIEISARNFKALEKKITRLEGIIEILQNINCTATHPNKIWVSDVTKTKVFYICAIIDLYSRMVVVYRISHKNSTQLTKGTFKQAYENRQPDNNLLFHTDRGANYRSNTFCSYLKSLNVTQSFSRADIPYDNSVMESFFSSLKREELYRTKYRSENEFRTAVKNYMIFLMRKDLMLKADTRHR